MFIRAGKNLRSESKPESGFSNEQKHGSGLNFTVSKSKKAARTNCTTTKKTGFSIEKLHISDCLKKESSNVHLALGRITEYILVP